jgi:hypothetical protein
VQNNSRSYSRLRLLTITRIVADTSGKTSILSRFLDHDA